VQPGKVCVDMVETAWALGAVEALETADHLSERVSYLPSGHRGAVVIPWILDAGSEVEVAG
jgi:hypothetical protein